MKSELKILVELTVQNPAPFSMNDVERIKSEVESKITNPILANFLNDIGESYLDAEVVSVKYIEEHDTRI